MTIDECKKYLPNRWAEIIQQDPLLMEIFEEHDYDLEEEAVPPFLFQELRGGNIEHLRPIFALYGQTGLSLSILLFIARKRTSFCGNRTSV